MEIFICWPPQSCQEGIKHLLLEFQKPASNRWIMLCSLPLPHDFFFFSFYYKRLPFIASRKPGALQWISSAESLFHYGAPKVCWLVAARCREEGPLAHLFGATLSWEGLGFSMTHTDLSPSEI